MSTSEIRVHLNNTGQVLACCGLLLLADLAFGKRVPAEGWFEGGPSHGVFRLSVPGADTGDPAAAVLEALATCEITGRKSGQTTHALSLRDPFGLTVDWWLRRKTMKTWAGRQDPAAIAAACQAAMRASLRTVLHDPLNFRTVLASAHGRRKAPESSRKETEPGLRPQSPAPGPGRGRKTGGRKSAPRPLAPLSLDSRLAGSAIDVGFSHDAMEIPREACPVTELLALAALQVFQPGEAREAGAAPPVLRYHTWHVPAPWPVACAVFCGAAWLPGTRSWTFQVTHRDDEGRYKGLSFSREEV